MFLKTMLFTSAILLRYLFFFGHSAFHYEREWKFTDSLIVKKNLVKSVLVDVNWVYALAKEDKLEAQWVKAIIYRNHLQEIDDYDIDQSIKNMEGEISIAPPRIGSLLKSIEAEELFEYIQGHRYQLGYRTTVLADTSPDIFAWIISRFENRISKLYLSSIDNSDLWNEASQENLNSKLITGKPGNCVPHFMICLPGEHRIISKRILEKVDHQQATCYVRTQTYFQKHFFCAHNGMHVCTCIYSKR